MDQNRLPDCLSFIKHKIISQELLLEYHSKVDAMVEMIMSQDLIDYPMEKLHNYLWVISDLVKKAKQLNEELLNAMLRITTETTGKYP